MSSVASRMRNNGEAKADKQDKGDLVDFKMVTFSLAGKDYGIDIMKVSEIARFINFTYVPNTPAFVRGVYNLRGEIISIIDLRAMFNLPFQQKASTEEESGLILRLDTNLIGVVVDKIDKVVGIDSRSIQPPHPIFGDINIKYISGVVENAGRLYIILDVERVLGKPEESQLKVAAHEFHEAPHPVQPTVETGTNDEEQYKHFVAESLQALAGFSLSAVNERWFDTRFEEWKASRQQVQVRTMDDAKSFLEPFYSPFSSQLWGAEYYRTVLGDMPRDLGKIINVWNPGCGRGHETYSLAVLLREIYPDAQIKIWASDKDLLNISGAPNLVFPEREMPEYLLPSTSTGKNGLSFSQKIKDMILFEYHDISNNHGLPPMDIVFARDLVSFMSPEQQKRLIEEINEMTKKGGYVVLGAHEAFPAQAGWELKEQKSTWVARKTGAEGAAR